jgi:hypothetical protein
LHFLVVHLFPCLLHLHSLALHSTHLPSRPWPRPPEDHDAIAVITLCNATTVHHQHYHNHIT